MTTLPSQGTEEAKAAIRKGYLILTSIGMGPVVGGIIIKLTGGELDYEFWFGTLCCIVAIVLGLVMINKVKKQQRSEETNKARNES